MNAGQRTLSIAIVAARAGAASGCDTSLAFDSNQNAAPAPPPALVASTVDEIGEAVPDESKVSACPVKTADDGKSVGQTLGDSRGAGGIHYDT